MINILTYWNKRLSLALITGMLDLEDHLHVALHVEGEVVGPAEGALAQLALERFVPRVFPVVSAELVRAGELPAAVCPAAGERLLPGVGPQVRLEVGGLGVGLVAAGV